MRCLVTAGPTWEPVDQVRRLTNFSTGRLGGELANALAQAGHEVELFLSDTATWNLPLAALRLTRFSTTETLASALQAAATDQPTAVFHAAAVSDFRGGGVFRRTSDGSLVPVGSGKATTREGALWLELRPTPKIIAQLRDWFPRGRLAGWKYEVDGGAEDALARAREQLVAARTDLCVVNGAAYGPGFGLLFPHRPVAHCAHREELFAALTAWAADANPTPPTPR